MLVDTHLHLFDYKDDMDDIIMRARKCSVNKLIVSGSSVEDNAFNLEKLREYNDIYFSCGYHPEFADTITEKDFKNLEKMLVDPKVVAIGEIGLDYHYGKENREMQILLFRKQLDLAVKYKLPVVIHTRDAFEDTYNILKQYKLKGVIHCFSGSFEVAEKYVSLGFFLGIGGVVTFKNSKLKDIVKKIGIDNIVLETDSPFLSPYRSEKNEPANILVIAKFLSDFLQISINDIAKITTFNAEKIFSLSN